MSFNDLVLKETRLKQAEEVAENARKADAARAKEKDAAKEPAASKSR